MHTAEHKRLVGRNIVLARRLTGLSQESFAQQLGVPRSRLSDWERGHHEPTWPNLSRIAEALGRSVGWFHDPHPEAEEALAAAEAQLDHRRRAIDLKSRVRLISKSDGAEAPARRLAQTSGTSSHGQH
jgi:transcriptional regulator with XRE-family HTH domain